MIRRRESFCNNSRVQIQTSKRQTTSSKLPWKSIISARDKTLNSPNFDRTIQVGAYINVYTNYALIFLPIFRVVWFVIRGE